RGRGARVLLVGPAGSGKTTTLTALARDAVARRLADANAPLPLVGTIATWDVQERPPLHEWLAAEADADPSAVFDEIQGGRVHLFLDGLDELRPTSLEADAPPADPRRPFLEQLSDIPAEVIAIVTSRDLDGLASAHVGSFA